MAESHLSTDQQHVQTHSSGKMVLDCGDGKIVTIEIDQIIATLSLNLVGYPAH